MTQRPSPLAAFHLIGERPEDASGANDRSALRPALFSGYRDMSKIRHDYPLVLLSGAPDTENGGYVKSLSDICDGILQEIASPGISGEQIRRHVLGLEQEIRSLTAGGRTDTLSHLWDEAGRNMISALGKGVKKGAKKDDQDTLDANLQKARSTLRCDGQVVDCDDRLPAMMMSHAWAVSQRAKMHHMGARMDALTQKLSDILQVDFMHSDKARDARHLARSMGSADQKVFDFKAMSDILGSAPVGGPLPKARQARIRAAISALESQRFVVTTNGNGQKGKGKTAFSFEFDSCGQALKAFQDRLPDMSELVKAISIAELEIENRYDENRHDAFFKRFDEALLGPEDLAMFPSYLVCLAGGVGTPAEHAALFEVLRAGLPFKIVAQSNDILKDEPIGSGQLSFGTRGQQIANMAVGLNNVFVLQSAASSLYRLRPHVLGGLVSDRPALFSIFSGCGEPRGETASYLRAAAATEARAFPCFVYDPGAGEDRASRFKLDGNPQADADWPLHVLQYEDSEHNRLADEAAFTFVDFVAADGRYAAHFASAPQSDWHDDMVPVSTFLDEGAASGGNGTAAKVPYILVIDDGDKLHRAIVDEKLIDGARRCRDLWRGLRQLSGLDDALNDARKDAQAAATLAEAKKAWEQEKQSLSAVASPPAVVPEPDADAVAQVAAEPSAEAPGISPDEPYIETPRCTTCNECTDINNRMFAYNEDMQATIKDADAGTYRELVEAAETCQVCIIHPGLPRNLSEPGLDELIERAAPFNAP